MSTTSHSIEQTYIDDEIDLMPYVRHVASYWRWFVVSSIAAALLGLGVAMVVPKQYEASITFFMPESGRSNSTGSLMAQFGFLSSFEGGATGVYSGYLTPIFKSRRIKEYVAQQLIDEGWFESDSTVSAVSMDRQTEAVMAQLKFSKQITLKVVDGVHVMTFRHHDPGMVLPVLNSYLTALIQLNDELNIDSDRLQIVPLDEAIEPKGAVFPNHKTFVLGAIAMAILGVFGFALVEKIIKDMVAKG
jgi:uncharacterized protein involved in exopolysaccharide biosynthesis